MEKPLNQVRVPVKRKRRISRAALASQTAQQKRLDALAKARRVRMRNVRARKRAARQLRKS